MTMEDPKKTNGLNGKSAPTPPLAPLAEAPADDAEASFAIEPAPEAVSDLKAACERFVLARYRVKLDGTKDTLSILDQYVKDARAEVLAKPESLLLLQAAIGAYFGEVVRGEFPATWFAEGDHDGWRLDMTRVFLTFNPIGMAREALTLVDAEGWHAHIELDEAEREVVEGRIARLGHVEEEEYYAPTSRFEIIEIAVDAIRTEMQEQGLSDVTFSREDYRK